MNNNNPWCDLEGVTNSFLQLFLPDADRVSIRKLRLAGICRVQGQHKEHRDLLGQEN